MQSLVDVAMKEGAVGLSTGLLYVPGTYADTDEVIELARAAARHGGIYATHIREQGANLHQSIEEAVTIGREANLPVQISHFKIKGKKYFKKQAAVVAPFVGRRITKPGKALKLLAAVRELAEW